jgi:F0F1-type ATP synthase membrane subunit b/b'
MLKEDLAALKSDVLALRDELKLKIHLARMDLKTEWEKLEPEAERAWNDVSEQGLRSAKELKQKLQALRDDLKKSV